MKNNLKKALQFMISDYCRHLKEGKELLAVDALANYTGFKLGLSLSLVFSDEELDIIEKDVKASWNCI
jgi:hypothetical protein